MKRKSYNNPWVPAEAVEILGRHTGSILDLGGGVAPYYKASLIVDIQPFNAERLTANCWGGHRDDPWTSSGYAQLDVYAGRQLPFAENEFALGLCSHMLEDLRDPVFVVQELARVCEKVMLIMPSRLLAQTMGVEHPRTCGFAHHPWFVVCEGDRLVFRRKSQYLLLRGAHVRCPIGKTLRPEIGSQFYYGASPVAEEYLFPSGEAEYADMVGFADQYRHRTDIFVPDGRQHDLTFWIWRLRQKYLGHF